MRWAEARLKASIITNNSIRFSATGGPVGCTTKTSCPRTFSKIYGLAGLRVGYGFARPETMVALNKVREAFNVSSLAQAAGTGALKDQDFVAATLKMNAEGIRIMQEGFDNLGLEHAPTCTNFILVDWKREGREVFQELLKRGVIIRPMYGYDLPTYGRVSTSHRKEMELFVEKLGEVLS